MSMRRCRGQHGVILIIGVIRKNLLIYAAPISQMIFQSHAQRHSRHTSLSSGTRAALLLAYKHQLDTHKPIELRQNQQTLAAFTRRKRGTSTTYAAVTANNSIREALLQSDIPTAQTSENAQTIPTRLLVSGTALRLTIEAQGRRMIMMELRVLLSMV